MRTVTVYGKQAEVNEHNPSFNIHLGSNLPYVMVKAIMGDERGKWVEPIKVSSLENAEQEGKEVIQFYNDTLQQGERIRKFHGLHQEDADVSSYEDREGMTGWLTPQGEFIPCKFGEHAVYANQFMENATSEERMVENQYIPMSEDSRSKYSHITILAELTSEQMDWFNRFYYKLSWIQNRMVQDAFKKQNKTLKWLM